LAIGLVGKNAIYFILGDYFIGFPISSDGSIHQNSNSSIDENFSTTMEPESHECFMFETLLIIKIFKRQLVLVFKIQEIMPIVLLEIG
jgi:hypothetical protein